MDNYGNDVPQQGFHLTEKCNIGNNIKIRISIDSKIPVEISQEQQQQQNEYTYPIRISVSPGKMTAHFQIQHIMENIHPQTKGHKEKVR